MRAAAQLRRSAGLSVDQIALKMGVADSTIYNWFDKMNISLQSPAKPVQEPAVAEAPIEKNDPRDLFTQGYAKAAKDPFFRVICALYWGEGRLGDVEDLESTSEVSIASSDFSIINLWLKWLKTSDFDPEKKIRIHLNQNSTLSSDAVKRYWLNKLEQNTSGDPPEVVRVKSKTKHVSKKQEHGSAYVTVYNNDLRALILGGISYLKSLSKK